MPNGKPGDHPYTDIIIHGLRVYSEAIDRLVREIAELADERGRRELGDMLYLEYNSSEYNEISKSDLTKLERVLSQRRDQLRREATERGWET